MNIGKTLLEDTEMVYLLTEQLLSLGTLLI